MVQQPQKDDYGFLVYALDSYRAFRRGGVGGIDRRIDGFATSQTGLYRAAR